MIPDLQRHWREWGWWDHCRSDVRVIVVDESNILAYHSLVPKGDFRASGMNIIDHRELPPDAVKLVLNVTRKLGFTNLALDFLQSKDTYRF